MRTFVRQMVWIWRIFLDCKACIVLRQCESAETNFTDLIINVVGVVELRPLLLLAVVDCLRLLALLPCESTPILFIAESASSQLLAQ